LLIQNPVLFTLPNCQSSSKAGWLLISIVPFSYTQASWNNCSIIPTKILGVWYMYRKLHILIPILICSPDLPENEATFAISGGGITDAKE